MSMAATILPPPLCEGDRLTREEFLRRWEAMPDVKFAELIDGLVHMASPLSGIHSDFHIRLGLWLGFYTTFTPGCALRTDVTWLMSEDSVPQPDLSLRWLPEYGGQARLEGEYPAGAPELIVEVSVTSIARDEGEKLRLYERSGVREYLIVQPKKRRINWRELMEGKYREIAAEADGLLRSRVFPGLWLDPEALWNNDRASILALIQRAAGENAR